MEHRAPEPLRRSGAAQPQLRRVGVGRLEGPERPGFSELGHLRRVERPPKGSDDVFKHSRDVSNEMDVLNTTEIN